MRIKPRSESQLVNACVKYLNAKGIFAIRMNTGLIKTDKGSYFRSGKKGMADVLCLKSIGIMGDMSEEYRLFMPIWIELKRDEYSKQSIYQKYFQDDVERRGHKYLLIHSVDELIKEVG